MSFSASRAHAGVLGCIGFRRCAHIYGIDYRERESAKHSGVGAVQFRHPLGQAPVRSN